MTEGGLSPPKIGSLVGCSPNLRVPFGLRDGRLYEPTEVERGLACGCTCPACGSPLKARSGEVRPHFAHHVIVECAGAWESAVHRMAKQLIREARHLMVPALTETVTLEVFGERGTRSRTLPATKVRLTDVADEVSFAVPAGTTTEGRQGDGKAPLEADGNATVVVDVTGQVAGKGNLLIEVAVTHFCDEEKIDRLRRLGHAALEIDLSSVERDITATQLKHLVLVNSSNRKWLHNPRSSVLRELLRINLQKTLEAKRRHHETRIRERGLPAAESLEDYRYQRSYLQAAEALGFELAVPPRFLNTRVRGEGEVFDTPDYWQPWLFAAMRAQAGDGLWVFRVPDLAKWMQQHLKPDAPLGLLEKLAEDFCWRLQQMSVLRMVGRKRFRLLTTKSVQELDPLFEPPAEE